MNLLARRLTTESVSRSERIAAAPSIGELGDRGGVLVLQKSLSDKDAEIRTAASTAIGKLKATSGSGSSKGDSEESEPEVPEPSKASILSGPAEHWFLSADVLVTAKTTVTNGGDGISIDKATGVLRRIRLSAWRPPLGIEAIRNLDEGCR